MQQQQQQKQQQQKQLLTATSVNGSEVGVAGGPNDDRESVHSGRSSVNDKDRYVFMFNLSAVL